MKRPVPIREYQLLIRCRGRLAAMVMQLRALDKSARISLDLEYLSTAKTIAENFGPVRDEDDEIGLRSDLGPVKDIFEDYVLKHYKQDMYYAYLVAAYGYFESEILNAVDLLVKPSNAIERKHLKGGVLEKNKVYCERVLAVQVDDILWRRVKAIRDIRNCILHCYGNTTRGSNIPLNDIFAEVSKWGENLVWDDEGKLTLSVRLCELACDYVFELIAAIVNVKLQRLDGHKLYLNRPSDLTSPP